MAHSLRINWLYGIYSKEYKNFVSTCVIIICCYIFITIHIYYCIVYYNHMLHVFSISKTYNKHMYIYIYEHVFGE